MIAYSSLVCSDWLMALEVVRQMLWQRLEANLITFNSATSSCRVNWPWALRLVEQMSVRADAISYNSSMIGSEWQVAVVSYGMLRERSLEPTQGSYNTMLSSYEGASLWQRCLPQQELIGFNTCMSANEKAGQWQRGLFLFQELLRCACQASVVTYSGAVAAWGHRSWPSAMLLLQEADVLGLGDLILYNASITACERGANWMVAIRLLQNLTTRRLQADVVTFSSLMSACEKASTWPQALRVREMLACSTIEASVIATNAAISACDRAAKWPLALLLLKERPDGTAVSFSAAIAACERGQRLRAGPDDRFTGQI